MRRNVTLASVVAVGLWLAGSAALTPINHACAAQAQVSYSEDIAPVFEGGAPAMRREGKAKRPADWIFRLLKDQKQ